MLLPWSWQTLTPAGWALLVLLGALSTSGHFLLILGYMRAGAATLTPFLYFQIVFATLVGWLWFGHAPDAATLGGIAIIAGCGVLGTWLSSREQPATATAPHHPRAAARGRLSRAVRIGAGVAPITSATLAPMRLTHTYSLRVEFGDCDPAQIVWFPNFFRWVDGREPGTSSSSAACQAGRRPSASAASSARRWSTRRRSSCAPPPTAMNCRSTPASPSGAARPSS